MDSRLWHVFIERPRSQAPGAAAHLAKAISARYGIPADVLELRIAAGRFRVKGDVERAVADSFAVDLAKLGAVCTIVAASPPAPKEQQPPPPQQQQQGLGALTGDMPLMLSTLDGADDDASRAQVGRAATLPASFGPPPEKPQKRAPMPSSREMEFDGGNDVPIETDEPELGLVDPFAADPAQEALAEAVAALGPAADRFAPPEEGVKDELALVVDTAPKRPSTTAAPPAAAAEASAAAAPARPRTPIWKLYARDERVRLIAGALVAAAVGFLPATVIASVREHSAFADIDAQLERQQNAVVTRADWDGLDRVRDRFKDRKHAERQSIALVSLVIWAAVSGGVAWLWFRKIDWAKLAGPA